MPQKTSTSRAGLWFIIFAAISWGTVGVATQLLYTKTATNAFSISFFRLAIASPILLLSCYFLLGKRIIQIKPKDFFSMLVMGIFLALYQASFFAAIPLSGVAVASLIALCSAPIIVALISSLIAREHISGKVLFSLIGALLGTILLVSTNTTTQHLTFSPWGIFFAVLAAAGYAGVILIGQPISHRYHSTHINSVTFTTGAIVLFFFAQNTDLTLTYSPQGWLILLYLASIPSALAYALFMVGVRTTPATIVSIVTLCEPLTATILAWLILGEQLTLVSIFGAILLLGAISMLAHGKTNQANQ